MNEKLHKTIVSTRHGEVVMGARQETFCSHEAATILIPGAAQDASTMIPWLRSLPNAIIVLLPGHGAPLLEQHGIHALLEAYEEALSSLQRPLFIVGESLGGLIGLCLPYPAIAIDPPIRTDNLWPVWISLNKPSANAYRDVLEPIFRRGQDFRPLIRGGDIITGDVPLMPARHLAHAPCLFEADIAPKTLRIHRLRGGHNLRTEEPGGCFRIVCQVMSAHGYNVN